MIVPTDPVLDPLLQEPDLLRLPPDRISGWLIVLIAAVLIAAVVASVLSALRRRSASPDSLDPEPASAFQTARDALAKLEARLPATPDEFERFFVELTCIVRGFMEARLGLPAPKRTTGEILALLRSLPEMPREGSPDIEQLLTDADRAKFVRSDRLDEPPDPKRDLELARSFVEMLGALPDEPQAPEESTSPSTTGKSGKGAS